MYSIFDVNINTLKPEVANIVCINDDRWADCGRPDYVTNFSVDSVNIIT